MDVTLVTCSAMPEPDVDEQPLLDALAAAGIEARLCAWDDPTVDWGASPLTVVRSAWNYAADRDAFLRWARATAGESTVVRNPIAVLGPNTHKSYLAALERAELPVVPTRWFARGGTPASVEAMRSLPWREIVLKPAVGGGSTGVRAFDLDDDEQLEAAAQHARALQARGEVLAQPRLASIVEEGERDVVWIDGECTHTVTKLSRLEDDEEQATTCRAPSEEEARLVRRVLATVPAYSTQELLYARVDVARDELGTLRIIELELVEPSLFLTLHEPAMERFVRALARGVSR
jgi:glutathione synthase/RimK-type ligase-like ATP-grasp enzyme